MMNTERRDDNFAFTGLPLNNSSARSHRNTVGFKGLYNYDITFSLSADKSQLTVTTKTALANPDYQLLLSTEYYGSKPDIAFNPAGVKFTRIDSSRVVKALVTVCNPGSGNSNAGMPVSLYAGDPTRTDTAKLMYSGIFPAGIRAGECKEFTFDIDLSRFASINKEITIIANDNGATAGSQPFSLNTTGTQHPLHQECFYDNNLLTVTTGINTAPSLGERGAFEYRNLFHAGDTAGVGIVDNDLQLIDPDGDNMVSATITLTNTPDVQQKGYALRVIYRPASAFQAITQTWYYCRARRRRTHM
ncbi:hypothetical protein MKQ70_11235 [Chitinophaga sedimenti]|uniref:hypothetical protein n=1 Tax=Chitinophaga sedimenti TaxID=2033606 RepID=UPI0020037DEA|nr:hypothetical protein [Chitinophaga sedimenti]MCK7555550.1 hypothetical protein [Chitinophaga sedimenti]